MNTSLAKNDHAHKADQDAAVSTLTFAPHLHHRITGGPFAGAWRANAGASYGGAAQVAESRLIRAEGGVVLPPDPLAGSGISQRFGLLGKLLGINR
jgi:hypothetical protein